MKSAIPIKQQIVLFKRLGLLLQGGTTLPKALLLVSGSASKRKVILYSELSRLVSHGKLFSEVLHSLRITDSFITGLIYIGEQTGTLDRSLDRAVSMLEKKEKMQNRLITAALYPSTLIVCSGLVLLIILIWVVPKIGGALAVSGLELPVLTRGVIYLSYSLRNEWWIWAGVFMIIMLVFVWIFKYHKAGFFSRVLAKIPFFGKAGKGLSAGFALKSLAVLIAGGVPISTALKSCSESMAGTQWQAVFERAIVFVERGQSFSDCLQDETCPVYVKELIVSGEQSGKLADSLLASSLWIEQEADETLSRGLALLEPMVLLCAGVIIALVAASVIVPIYGFTNILTK